MSAANRVIDRARVHPSKTEGDQRQNPDSEARRLCSDSGMRAITAAISVLVVAGVPAAAQAQDPSWTLIRPDKTLANQWKVEPRSRALSSVLDEPIYTDERPVTTGDRASATRRKQRFAVAFTDIDAAGGPFAGGQMWIYIGIRKKTRVDIAVRTRRDGHSVIVSFRKRVTPPVTIAPEEPPVGRNGFRGWLPVALPPLLRAEASELSLAVRVSPSSQKRSLSRVYAAFAELYPETM
jgi:hypothetical protein